MTMVYPAGMANHRTPFHSSSCWQKARRIARITAEHRCSRCGKFMPSGLHVHHQIPVSKSMAVSLEPLNLSTACPQYHNSLEPRTGAPRIMSGCDELGNPLSPDHPWFQK